MVLCMVISTTGCMLYKEVPKARQDVVLEKRLNNQLEYIFVLHHAEGMSRLYNVSMLSDTLRAYALDADSTMVHFNPLMKSKRIRKSNEDITKEVHFYTGGDLHVADRSPLAISTDLIQDIKIIKHNDAVTIASVAIPVAIVIFLASMDLEMGPMDSSGLSGGSN